MTFLTIDYSYSPDHFIVSNPCRVCQPFSVLPVHDAQAMLARLHCSKASAWWLEGWVWQDIALQGQYTPFAN